MWSGAQSWSPDPGRGGSQSGSQAAGTAPERPDRKRPTRGRGGGLAPTNHRGETKTQGDVTKGRVQRESGRRGGGEGLSMEEEGLSVEEALFGYDAQWCWVESQDDVTFL